MNASIKKVSSVEELQSCFNIRHEVFVLGQNVPVEEELDGKDETSDHYLLSLDDAPAGVARVRYLDEVAKIERVAILNQYQGKGLGKLIMNSILADLKGHAAITTAKLSAQTHAISFYERLGFVVCSEEYLDAGIPHRDMVLALGLM